MLDDFEISDDDSTLEAEFVTAKEDFLARLPRGEYRQVVEYLLMGFNRQEITDKLGVSLRTVDRMLAAIRRALIESLELGSPEVGDEAGG